MKKFTPLLCRIGVHMWRRDWSGLLYGHAYTCARCGKNRPEFRPKKPKERRMIAAAGKLSAAKLCGGAGSVDLRYVGDPGDQKYQVYHREEK